MLYYFPSLLKHTHTHTHNTRTKQNHFNRFFFLTVSLSSPIDCHTHTHAHSTPHTHTKRQQIHDQWTVASHARQHNTERKWRHVWLASMPLDGKLAVALLARSSWVSLSMLFITHPKWMRGNEKGGGVKSARFLCEE